jgi:hypothetical protein
MLNFLIKNAHRGITGQECGCEFLLYVHLFSLYYMAKNSFFIYINIYIKGHSHSPILIFVCETKQYIHLSVLFKNDSNKNNKTTFFF